MYELPKFGGVEGDFHFNGEKKFYGDVEYRDVESGSGDLGNANGIKHVYRDDTWKHKFFNYDPKPHEFVGVSKLNIEWN
jgi:hypothetical protein